MIVECFHGTTSSRATNIIKNGFRPSRAARMWLGSGVYFYQDGYDLCRLWAEATCRRSSAKPDDKPVVLRATIDLTFGIDLMCQKHWPLLKSLYEDNKNTLDIIPQNGVDTLVRENSLEEKERDYDHPFDHRLIDTLVDVERINRQVRRQPLPTLVRGVFIEGKPVNPKSWLFDSSCVIVSVIDSDCIIELTVLS